MQATPDPQPSYTMIAAAARIAQRLGLHASLDNASIAIDEFEQRKNVFWLAYILDKGACLRSGYPPTLHDEDVGIQLPDLEQLSVQLRPNEPRFSIFRSMTELALLESRVYSQLYSARSRLFTKTERLRSVAQLDKDLESWKGRLPLNIRPGGDILCDESPFMAVLMLQFSYYDCLETIHRASSHHKPWFSEPDETPAAQDDRLNLLNPRIYSSTAICVNAARSIVGLMRYFTHDNARPRESLNWMAVYYPLSAALALFANVIQNPEDSNAESDINLMRIVTNFFSTYMAADRSKSLAANRTILIFEELCRTAATYVEKVRAKFLPKAKRPREKSTSGNEGAIPVHPADLRQSRGEATTSPQPTVTSVAQSPLVHDPLLSQTTTTMPPLALNKSMHDDVPSATSLMSSSTATGVDTSTTMSEDMPNLTGGSFEWDLANLWGWYGDAGGALDD